MRRGLPKFCVITVKRPLHVQELVPASPSVEVHVGCTVQSTILLVHLQGLQDVVSSRLGCCGIAAFFVEDHLDRVMDRSLTRRLGTALQLRPDLAGRDELLDGPVLPELPLSCEALANLFVLLLKARITVDLARPDLADLGLPEIELASLSRLLVHGLLLRNLCVADVGPGS